MKNKYFYLLVSLFLLGSCSSNAEVSVETTTDNDETALNESVTVDSQATSEELDAQRPEKPESTGSFDGQRPPRGEMMGSGELDHNVEFGEEGERPEKPEGEYSDSESSAS